MSEVIEVTEIAGKKRISVSFTRKLSDGNYGGWEATAWIEGEVPTDATPQQIAEGAANLFLSAKAAVLDELGIKWGLDSDTGLVKETETPFVSAAATGAAVQRTMGGAGSSEAGNIQDGIKIMNWGAEGVSTDPVPAKVLAEMKKDGITAIWDQRHTATGKQPQFKEAVPRGGTGHGKEGMAKGYWS